MFDLFYSSKETPVSLKNHGNILLNNGRVSEAEQLYRRAIGLDPGFMPAHYNLGNALRTQGRFEEALAAYESALKLAPDDYEICMNMGATLIDLGRAADALQAFSHANELMPGAAEPLVNMGVAYGQLGQLEKSMASGNRSHQTQYDLNVEAEYYNKALLIKPDLVVAHNYIGHVLRNQVKLDAAIESYRKALLLKPDYAEAYTSLLLAIQYSPKYTPSEIIAEHQRFAKQFEAPLKPFWPVHKNVREPKKRLKVGYVSGDFRDHAVAYFIEPILANHDKSQVEVFCYSNHPSHDSITDRIIAMADYWIPCKGLSDEQLAERIHSDGIDILVDLSGHTAHNRLLAFARKPAPIQVTWLGYPGTTGLAAMDYRLTDEYQDPVGMTEQYHTETLLRLPSSATFQPAAESPPLNALPALTSNQFTLACLNNLVKINQDAIRLWARILVALPHARLMLGNATDEQTRQKLIDMFAQESIGAERLVLHPTMPLGDYLALHHQIDLALDTFPYNGGTSTCHSLWMGVPVITLAGNNSAARVGVAVMAGVGLTEFVTTSTDEYFERALAFANDLPGLDRVRQSLRERMAAQSIANPLHLTRHLEEAFRNIWGKWCDGEKVAG